MNVTDPKIISLRESVKAAQQEFNVAVMFHETWKPTAYDDDLHRRMESWSRKSGQDDKWSFCLTAGTLCAANQERQ
jgi:hypothetical protein